MSKLLNQIIEWIQTRPYWEQFALKMILDGKTFENDHFDKLSQWCLEDKKINALSEERSDIGWEIISKSFSDSQPQSIKLNKLFNLQNVNALSEDHFLTFHPNLTLIYGANGSGKSGYTRLLAHLGIYRGDLDILPNIYSKSEFLQPNFNLEVIENGEIRTINFEVGKEHQKIGGIYVFDSSTVVKQITKTEKISFAPSGLKILTQLSDVVSKTIERFQSNFSKYSNSHSFEKLFQGNSQISQIIRGLEEKSIFERLKKLVILTDVELKEKEDLEKRLVSLKTQSVDSKIAEYRKILTDLKRLINNLTQVEILFDKNFITKSNQEIENLITLESKLSQYGIENFQSSKVSNIGSKEWHQFINAALTFARIQDKYPKQDSECLLCHQKLTLESFQLIQSLWNFLQDDIQDKLNECNLNISKKIKQLENLDINFFNENEIGFIYLNQNFNDLVNNLQFFIKECFSKRETIIKSIQKKLEISFDTELNSYLPEIEKCVIHLESEITRLQNTDPKQEIQQCETQLREIEHRIILQDNWEQIKDYRDKKDWYTKSLKALGSTIHITRKYNELFQSLVTDKYTELFKQILQDLNCPMTVDISTKSQKAEVLRKIILKAVRENTPDKILSEGEKRAVAIADFLTEATLDENSKVIVLDDPITSLDYDWKEIMARRLISESRNKQVIIFTHDLPFLFQLKNFSDDAKVEYYKHSIEKGGDNISGQTILNFIPESVEDYRNTDKAKAHLTNSQKANSAEERIMHLRSGFNALRTTYESFIVYKLFGGTVRRFDKHVKVGYLNNVRINDAILEKIEENFGFLSRFTGGHLDSNFQPSIPSSEILNQEILKFEDLLNEWKSLPKRSKNKTH